MRLFAIGDLHLLGGDDKPMDVFGEHWKGHFERISEDWRARVGEEDTVLILGDTSWAMQLSAAVPDLQAIGALPGRKILIKGNHDYWWNGIGQVRRVLPESMFAIQHDAIDLGCCVVTGTRGWSWPTETTPLPDEDMRVFNRELIRLELGLQSAVKIAAQRPIVVMLHYPPLYSMERETPFTRMLEAYPVHTVAYGHLHGSCIRAGFTGLHNGIRYQLASCDSLGFSLAELLLGTEQMLQKT